MYLTHQYSALEGCFAYSVYFKISKKNGKFKFDFYRILLDFRQSVIDKFLYNG